MAGKFNLATHSNKVIEKLKLVDPENPSLYSNEISECISNAMLIGTISTHNEVILYMTLMKKDGVDYYRFLYQIKTSVNGKIKNIDSVMSLIRDFEKEFVCADRVRVHPEGGAIFVDILKRKN